MMQHIRRQENPDPLESVGASITRPDQVRDGFLYLVCKFGRELQVTTPEAMLAWRTSDRRPVVFSAGDAREYLAIESRPEELRGPAQADWADL